MLKEFYELGGASVGFAPGSLDNDYASAKLYGELEAVVHKGDLAPKTFGDVAIFVNSDNKSVSITNAAFTEKKHHLIPKFIKNSNANFEDGSLTQFSIQPYIATLDSKMMFAIRYKGSYNFQRSNTNPGKTFILKDSKSGKTIFSVAAPGSAMYGLATFDFMGVEIYQFQADGLVCLTPDNRIMHIISDNFRSSPTSSADAHLNDDQSAITAANTDVENTALDVIADYRPKIFTGNLLDDGDAPGTAPNNTSYQNMAFDLNGGLWLTFMHNTGVTRMFGLSSVSQAFGIGFIPFESNRFNYVKSEFSAFDIAGGGVHGFGRTSLSVCSIIAGAVPEEMFVYLDSTDTASVIKLPDLISQGLGEQGSPLAIDSSVYPKKFTQLLKIRYSSSINGSGYYITDTWSAFEEGSDYISSCGGAFITSKKADFVTGITTKTIHPGSALTAQAHNFSTVRFVYNKTLDYIFIVTDNKFCDGTPNTVSTTANSTFKPWVTVIKGSTFVKVREFGFDNLSVPGKNFRAVFSEEALPYINIATDNNTGVTSIITSTDLIQFDGAFNVQYLESFSGYRHSINNIFDPIRGLIYGQTPFTLSIKDERLYPINTRVLALPSLWINILHNPNISNTGLVGGSQQVFPALGGATPVNQPILIFKLYPININSTMQFVLFRHTNGDFLIAHKQDLALKGAKMRFISWYDPDQSKPSLVGGALYGHSADLISKDKYTATVQDNTASPYTIGSTSSSPSATQRVLGLTKTLSSATPEYDAKHSIKADPTKDIEYVSEHYGPVGWQNYAGAKSTDGKTTLNAIGDSMSLPVFYTYSKEAVDNTIEYLQSSNSTSMLLDATRKFYNVNNIQAVQSKTEDGSSGLKAYSLGIPFVDTSATVSNSDDTSLGGSILSRKPFEHELRSSEPKTSWKRVGHLAPSSSALQKGAGANGVLCTAEPEYSEAWVAIKLPKHADLSSYYVLYGFISE